MYIYIYVIMCIYICACMYIYLCVHICAYIYIHAYVALFVCCSVGFLEGSSVLAELKLRVPPNPDKPLSFP